MEGGWPQPPFDVKYELNLAPLGADHHQIFGRRNIGKEPTQGKRMIPAGAGEAGKDDEKIEPNRKKQFRLALPGPISHHFHPSIFRMPGIMAAADMKPRHAQIRIP